MPVGAAIGGAAVVGAGANLMAANKQAESTDKASAQQMKMYETTRADLAPYRDAGTTGMNMLMGKLPELTTPITFDQAALAKTPGYQFARSQGLKATQSGAAARGLGKSGAAAKGAATFATGLADQTFGDQFNREMAQREATFNRLMGVTTVGQNAAAQTGAYGTQTAQQVGQNTIVGGTAQAAGIAGAGNALTNAANNFAGYKMYQSMYGAH